MSVVSRAKIARAFADGDAATTSTARGRALEDLLAYLFCKFKGVRLVKRNVMTANQSEEIDLVFWNDRSLLDFLPNVLMFECKNWASPVDSASVSFFITKAVNRHLSHAFLIAANGITGDRDQLRNAHAHLHNALTMHDCKVIVLDRAELMALQSTEGLIALIVEKISELYLLGV